MSFYLRETAIHEARHAVACLGLGGFFNGIHLSTREQREAGDFIVDERGRARDDAAGLCDARMVGEAYMQSSIIAASLRSVERVPILRAEAVHQMENVYAPRPGTTYAGEAAKQRDLLIRYMTMTAVGPIAEAVPLDMDLCDVFANYAMGDEATVHDFAEVLACVYGHIALDQRRGLACSVSSLWSETLRKAEKLVRRFWSEIEVVADLCQPNRYTDGEDIGELFFKMQPRLAA